MVITLKKTKHWQNLVFKKCPNCDSRLDDHKRGYQCPDALCGFFVTKEGLLNILTDPNHAATKFLSKDAREYLEEQLKILKSQTYE